MTGITKQEAATLWGNGFKLQDKEGDEYSIVAVYDDKFKVSCDNPEMYNSPFDLKYDAIGNIAFIIARPLSQLTQEIEHEGEVIVPIVELAKIAIPDLEWELNTDGTKAISKFDYDNETEWFSYHKGEFCTSRVREPFRVSHNQKEIFAYMDSLHFDRFGWAERGLTVDKSK